MNGRKDECSSYTSSYYRCADGNIFKIISEESGRRVHRGLFKHPSLNDSDYYLIKLEVKNKNGQCNELDYIVNGFAVDENGEKINTKRIMSIIGVPMMDIDLGETTHRKINLYINISVGGYRDYYDDNRIIIVILEIDRVNETLSINKIVDGVGEDHGR